MTERDTCGGAPGSRPEAAPTRAPGIEPGRVGENADELEM